MAQVTAQVISYDEEFKRQVARMVRACGVPVGVVAEPQLILQAMRAGANEFFPWGAAEGSQEARATEESFHGAVRKTAARREAASAGAKPPCVTHAFLGAKGGAGTP